MQRKRVILVLVVVVALAGWFLFKWQYPSQKGLIQSKLPGFFPKELISESDVQIQAVGSDAVKLVGEKHRAIVSYKSNLDVGQNQDYFIQYLKNNNFETQTNDLSDSVMISGTKERTTLSVTIWKRNPVQISILYILNK